MGRMTISYLDTMQRAVRLLPPPSATLAAQKFHVSLGSNPSSQNRLREPSEAHAFDGRAV